ncbi:MAG: Gfo/Idh/MocA family oxidoreductase [Verrucomicrobiae bacterium]|nr:Gfo/Idh/MocA family oxidoreductase [Verrucomicrobiae bacterium]
MRRTPPSRLRFALIGCGAMGSHALRSAKSDRRLDLVACADRDASRLKRVQKEYGFPAVGHWRDLLEREDVDLFYIATPNRTHREIAVEFLRRGRNVLLEKPMAASVADCAAIMRAWRRRRPFFQLGFECRYSIAYLRLKKLVASGALGEIRHYHLLYSPGIWFQWLEQKNGWKYRARESGGMVAEKISHYLDLFTWFSGSRIREVHTLFPGNVIRHFEVMDNFHLNFRADSGAVGAISFFFSRAPVNRMDGTLHGPSHEDASAGFQLSLIGTKGAAYFDLHKKTISVTDYGYERKKTFAPRRTMFLDFGKQRFDRPGDFNHASHPEILDACARAAAGRPPAVDPEDSYHIMKVCFAAERSARLRRGVRVN